ncbi:tannase/feruloyl esterase family alpha/beta hydrolase [Sphingomonas oligophenolica]|uniref:Tannase/feruloyl esterase family alpha/beta hydrolase n=1 Tax=Sphingomonas oligophenolica TaxID=301154 RepID=A0ABU9YBR8_9SPHN
MRIPGAIALATFCLAAGIWPSMAQAQTASPGASTALSAKCEALAAEDLAGIPDAPTHLNSAKLIVATADKPAYCETEGYVAPQVGILMWLPAEGWNGKFLQVGCGGFCGSLAWIGACEEPLKKGYACITTDMGHRAKEAEGVEWAYNNPQAVMDFAYRATHVTALAGKAIVQRYYGRRPDRSYFSGCSCGGRQALVEAERFPWDFNGIIVGAPGMNYPDIALNFAQRAHFLYSPSGAPLFDSAAIRFLNKAVIAKCDMNDGLKDGQIGDPRLCTFDPRAYVCPPGATADCLTPAQADAAVSFYSEHRSASGDRVGDRAFLPGSEISYLGMNDNPLMKRTFYEDFLKYMALVPNPGPAWKFENFDPDADYKRFGLIQSLFQADNPDLHQFKEAGGKLIFYHGWADAGPSPLTSIAFYKTIERTMGGRAATEDFLRLFMVPDMDHCGAGKGPWVIDYLDYLEKWVEKAKAPDVMIGAHFTDEAMSDHKFDPAKPKFTRPIFPYPLRAQYKGKGDPNSAASFKPVRSDD